MTEGAQRHDPQQPMGYQQAPGYQQPPTSYQQAATQQPPTNHQQAAQQSWAPPYGFSGVQSGPVPPRPPEPQTSASSEWGRMGGGIIVFVILQALQTFALLSSFPSSLEDALESVMSPGVASSGVALAEAVSDWLLLVMLVVYAVAIIVAMVQLVQRHPAFLRNFQVAGLVAVIGNLVVFVMMEAINVFYSVNPGAGFGDVYDYAYSWHAESHWTFVILALMWTIFWTLYFVRSVRVRHYMSPNNPYSPAGSVPYVERALFGRGMRG